MSELRPRTNRAAKTTPVIARHGRLRKAGPWGTVLSIVGAALAVVLVSGAAVAGIVVNQLQSNIDVVQLVGETEGPPPSIGAYEGGFNILLVGSDQCEFEDGCGGRGEAKLNDVTMLLHVSADQTNAVAVSFPRDLVVPVPSCPREDGSGNYGAMSGRPINETLSYGGLPCTVLTVSKLTGLDIQFAGLITFTGVINMSNAIGGVPVCIDAPINDRLSGLYLPTAGTHTLSGQQALDFLRTRHGVGDGSDLTRISSQQVFLSSLVRTIKSSETLSDPLKVYGLARAATQSMELSTGLANVDTLASIALALKDIPLESITFVQYPGTTGQSGIFTGKVAPITAQADKLFAKILADEPFTLAQVGDGRGSTLDPNAAPITPDPAATVDPAAPVPETLTNIRGQTAADQTCSVAN